MSDKATGRCIICRKSAYNWRSFCRKHAVQYDAMRPDGTSIDAAIWAAKATRDAIRGQARRSKHGGGR